MRFSLDCFSGTFTVTRLNDSCLDAPVRFPDVSFCKLGIRKKERKQNITASKQVTFTHPAGRNVSILILLTMITKCVQCSCLSACIEYLCAKEFQKFKGICIIS